MNSVIKDLLTKILSDNTKISDNAIIDISVIIEMHTWHLSAEERQIRFGSLVSQNILNIYINETDETEIVKFLVNAIGNSSGITSSLLSIIGHANAKVALLPLTETIEKYFEKFDQDEIYQCLVALERLLFFDESLLLPEKLKIVQNKNIGKIISRKILSLQPISHVDLESTSLRLLAMLISFAHD